LSDSPQGHNPLRWNCAEQGCFNKLRRPKIEVFADCFPRRINFGDVDGLVELNGKGLLLEWKCGTGQLPTGQKRAYQNLTKTGLLTVICITGNAETMECDSYGLFYQGRWHEYRRANLDMVKKIIRRWVDVAK